MRKIIGVLLIIGGILFASLAFKAIFSVPQTEQQIRNAATVQDGIILSENEGKLVVVSGKLKADEPIVDPITGVKLPGVTAARTVWTYKDSTGNDDERTWDWHPENTDYSESANYGINAETFVSTMLAAPTSLGEYKVEPKLLTPLMRTTKFKDYDKSSLKSGWNILTDKRRTVFCVSKLSNYPEKEKGGYSSWADGAKRITYDVVSPDDPLEYSIVGIQKGNTITKADDLDSVTTFKGIMTADELAAESAKGIRGGSIFGIVAGIVLAVIGFGMIVIRRQ